MQRYGINRIANVIHRQRLASSLHSQRSFSSTRGSSDWKRNGTPEMVFGSTILFLLGLDYYLQQKQEETRLNLKSQLQSIVRSDHQQDHDENWDSNKKMLTLFQCAVRRLPDANFDGYKCLSSSVLELGDIVDVLEEKVGPDKMYNLCRITKTGSNGEKNDSVHIGWFPTSFLEKLP